MKWGMLVLALMMTGCASVSDIESTPATMNVISGKKPDAYAKCVVDKLDTGRDRAVIEPHKEGFKVIVPQSLSSSPAAVIDVQERSSGSKIEVHEFLANMPLRPWGIRNAATECISG